MWKTNDSYNKLRLDQLPSGWILASATKIKIKKTFHSAMLAKSIAMHRHQLDSYPGKENFRNFLNKNSLYCTRYQFLLRHCEALS